MATSSESDEGSIANPTREPSSGAPSAVAFDLFKPAFIIFLVVFSVAWVSIALEIRATVGGRWLPAVFLVTAAVTSLMGLGRRLPGQNVMAAAALIAALASLIEVVGVLTNVPFGPRIYTDGLGLKLFNMIPWSVPLLWIVGIVSGRGVARLIMRPWRKTTYYGFWVIGLTSALLVTLDMSFEPFASIGHQFWFWRMPKTVFTWYTSPWVKFLGSLVTAIAIMGFATPWLINKQPVKQATDYHPLVMWLLLSLLLATDHFLHGRWLAFGWAVGTAVLVAGFAVRGARW